MHTDFNLTTALLTASFAVQVVSNDNTRLFVDIFWYLTVVLFNASSWYVSHKRSEMLLFNRFMYCCAH